MLLTSKLVPLVATSCCFPILGYTLSVRVNKAPQPEAHALSPRGAGSTGAGILWDAFLEGLLAFSSKELKAKWSNGPTCCDNAVDDCRINTGMAANGQPWMACYVAGSEKIYDFDVEAMKCIINLHFTQADKCISIDGSICANGYGGGLMRGQLGWWGGGKEAYDQLSAEDSATLQAAAESMVGVGID